MKLSTIGTDDARFDMTPMMDIVFQLIAFFMIVATYVTREKVEVDLPLAVNAAIAENQQDRALISISIDGQVWAGSRSVSLDELATTVSTWIADNGETKIVIRADRSNSYGLVKQVMKICRDAGIADIIFSSFQTEGGG
ncbi:ExbD/TolR family protein [Synoicihabitans lomoniglobus]|uniref:Biopolymer transporter ExbD n=1 Tax=Synoicihabitans lomoniglobus TaxID=2909285 RepID=A0AAE9ZX65_9BACT|nr:biopolymer transporter ExbD [Opitutaceae bacterium LMO-M01]WED64739.1 biopolymer transporter ExbD [Opitutaceae bacterium LMO-M01]